MINHYNALPASERIVYSLGAIIEGMQSAEFAREIAQVDPNILYNAERQLNDGNQSLPANDTDT